MNRSKLTSLALLVLALASAPVAARQVTITTGATATSAGAHSAALRLPAAGEFNALVIVLDDAGTDQFSMYAADGGPPSYCVQAQEDSVPTPNLDALAAGGILFTSAYSNPTCSPTRAAVLTGRYGMRNGCGMMINRGESPPYTLPTTELFLAELIRNVSLPTSGYKTGAFGKWHMADVDTGGCHPTDAGFQVYEGFLDNPDDQFNWTKTSNPGNPSGCSSDQQIEPALGDPPTEDVWTAGVNRVDCVNWINSLAPTDRFFAHIAFSPPHEPWQVPPFRTLSTGTAGRLSFLGYEAGDFPVTGQTDEKRMIYQANLEGVDFEIGQLLAGIPAAVLARTMVIVIGDNGTVGDLIKGTGLNGHGKRTLYELGTRVPLIVSGPLVRSPGTTCRRLVSGVDVWRTVTNIVGLSDAAVNAVAGAYTIDSVSFLRQIYNPSAPPNRSFAYSESFRNGYPVDFKNYQRGITDGTYRYMRIYNSLGTSYTSYLYYNTTDPCEFTNLYPPAPLSAAETAMNALITAMNAL